MLISCESIISRARKTKGFSLVTVLSLGLISTMMLFALTASILPLYQKASQNIPYTQLRNAAESGINTVVSDLNNSLQTNQPSLYDETVFGGPDKKTTVLGQPTVQITVKNQAPIKGDFLYNSAYDFSPPNPIASSSFYTSNPWRVTEALAFFDITQPPQVLARGVLRRTIPPRDPLLPKTSFLTSTNNSPSLPVFNYAVFAAQKLIVRSSTVKGTNSLEGDVGSNGTAGFFRGTDIDGSVTVSSATDPTSQSMNVATGNQSVIHDQLIVNGKYSGFQAGTNVLGEGPGNSSNPIPTPPTNTAPNKLPATPEAPSTANSLGDLNLQNGAKILFQNNAVFPPSTSSLAAFASGGTLALPPGDYTVNSLNVSGASGISMSSSLNQPVRLFVSAKSDIPITVSGNGIQNATNVPANLQIYYGGSNAVNISGASFNGVIYAPGANVTIGSSQSMNVFGSIIGNTVFVQNAALKFDSNLANATYLTNQNRTGYTSASNLTYDPTQYASSTIPFSALSYQEVNNPK